MESGELTEVPRTTIASIVQATIDGVLLQWAFDPEAVDERGRKLKKPVYNHVHIRARARVNAALKNWDAAEADAEEVVKFLTSKGGWMSMRPVALDEAEELLESIKKQRGDAK